MNRRSYAVRLLIFATLVTITAVTITGREPTAALARRDVFADELAASRAAISLPAVPATRSTSQGVAAAGQPVASGGMRASFDPESGGLGTLSALPPLTEVEEVLREPTQPSRQVVMPDGSVMVELNGSCQEFMVLQIDANGSRSVQCIQDPKKGAAGLGSSRAER